MEFSELKIALYRGPLVKLAAGMVLLLAIAATFSAVAGSEPENGSSLATGPRVTAPHGTRIKIQVVNTTGKVGLGARATRYLRDRGFDVVEMGSSREALDSTVIVDRSGKHDWAKLVARSLGVPRVEQQPDSKRYLDVTVRLGADWVPPPGPFDP